VEVVFDISRSPRINTGIPANKIDLGLVSHEVQDPRLLSHVFMTDELVAIFPGNHKWAAKHRIMPRDLLGETYIMAAQGAGTRAVVEERLKEQGIVLQNVLDFGNLEGVKHAVEVGLGASIRAGSVVKGHR
jgi:DNA-binding transcriptional LysR family regulator